MTKLRKGIKFSEMTYKRPDMEAVMADMENYFKRIQRASSAKEQEILYREYEKKFYEALTMQELCAIRSYLDVNDEFYSGEQEYWDNVIPEIQEAEAKIHKALATSPYLEELKESLGSTILKKWELETQTIHEKILPLMAEENELVTKYTKLVSGATVDYKGETVSLSKMKTFFDDPNRQERREAFYIYHHWFYEHREELDGIYDELVKNRTKQARELGFNSYTELAYLIRGRIGYGREEIEAFRQEVLKKWVPFVAELKEEQRKRLEIPTFRLYDSPLRFKDGSPKLKVKNQEFLEAGIKMFHSLSKETGDYIDFLTENELMDLFDRPGKVPYDGFSEDITAYNENFIFGHFNGKETDLEVFTHEFGHSFAGEIAIRQPDLIIASRNPIGQEIAETHSKSMELLTSGFDQLFFDEYNLKKYQQKKIEYAAYFISSICIGDEFQHRIYDNPEMTPEDRNIAYEEIYKKYNPYIDYSDLPFETWGCMWQDTMVIYAMPFYLIDYALAQTLALQFYAESLLDLEGAWKRYMSFLSKAGTRTFTGIVKECGLRSPFEKDCFDYIYKSVKDIRSKLHNQN